MHPIELKVIEFLRQVGKAPLELEQKLLEPASKDVSHFLKKLFEEDRNRKFSFRLSAMARPLCQLQMEKTQAKAVEDDWNFPIRMMYGGVIEGLTMSILRHSGVDIQEEQTHVKLNTSVTGSNGEPLIVEIPGTLDVVIDNKVWDIKSASPYSFENKFKDYESLRESDDLGYLGQLYGYAAARGIPPGGWIVVDKSSGVLKVVEVPDNYKEDQDAALLLIQNNTHYLHNSLAFQRCFTDYAETVRKKPTGNRVLQAPCTFCKYKYSCWPGLKHLPSAASTAYQRPYKYYTEYHENK